MTYPLRFHRLASARPWAGERLRALFPDAAAEVPAGTGEWVELCDLPDAASVVANGEWQGLTIGELAQRHREALLGPGAPDKPGDFPVCVKFLDTSEMLSVQVHPHDRPGVARGKSECWLVLDAAPEAVIYQGLAPGATPAMFEAALHLPGGPVSLMNARPVQRGDFIYNAAGMIHAIGAGLALLEIQQNCGVTWRLWDPPRGGPPRTLHIEQGLRDARLEMPLPPVQATIDEDVNLVDDGPFGVRSLRVQTARVVPKAWPGFTVFTCVEGACEITAHAGDNLQPARLKAGDTVLLPAEFDRFEIYPGGWLIASWDRG